MKGKMKKKQASTLIYLMSFMVVFLAFCAFAVDATIIFSQRSKLQNATEAAALSAAASFNPTGASVGNDIIKKADEAFSMWKLGDLKNAKITNAEVSIANKEVRLTTRLIGQPFFLSFLGVSGVDLNAVSAAKSEKLPVTSNYAGINWVTTAAAYRSDIVSKGTNLNDTAILQPLGNTQSASRDSYTGIPIFRLIDDEDNQPLSLGPGGYITLKLPAPIVDKPGPDILINEIGFAKEGYMVFVGLDVNPDNPYMQYNRTGAGLRWVNISCSGTSKNNPSLSPYSVSTPLGNQAKFYGSGYFDIGDSCNPAGGVAMAKYLRIVDDNDESGFLQDGSPAMLYGESSSPTAGADIDSVDVLNHVLLINPKNYTP